MICVGLILENKNVLIVGDGQTAQHKIKECLKEKANITVLSQTIHHSIDHIHYIEDSYNSSYLDHQFYVIAATNDPIMNQQIVHDCQNRNILVSSMTKAHINAKMMKNYESDTLLIGYSTNGQYPSYNFVLEKEIENIDHKHHDKIELLGRLRPYLLNVSNKRSLLNQACHLKIQSIEFLLKAIEGDKQSILFVPTAAKELDILYDEFEDYYICQNAQGTYEDLNLLYPYLEALKIDYTIYPLVLYDGLLYQKLSEKFKHLSSPIIQSQNDLDKLLQTYHVDVHTLLIYHPRQHIPFSYSLNACSFMDLDDTDLSDIHSLIPFLFSEGKHYQQDVLTKIPQGIEIQPVLLKNREAIHYFKQKWDLERF
ncbi:MAG: hypothetical protein LUG60_05375 [Erysipelotrichaceae bacterium]|nr:hypothetical protein [Erysipelotrichaceae bacterium]